MSLDLLVDTFLEFFEAKLYVYYDLGTDNLFLSSEPETKPKKRSEACLSVSRELDRHPVGGDDIEYITEL